MSLGSALSSSWFRLPLVAFAVVATVATSKPPPDGPPPSPTTPSPSNPAPGMIIPAAAERLTLRAGETRVFELRFSSTAGAVISSRIGAVVEGDVSLRVEHVDSRKECSTSEVFRSVDGKWVTGALSDGDPILRSSCLDTTPNGRVTVRITNVEPQTSTTFTWSPAGAPLGDDRRESVTVERLP